MMRRGVIAAVLVVVACGESPEAVKLTAPEAPSLSAASSGGRALDRHVFLMHKESIPAAFEAEVAAAGGTIVHRLGEIGVVVVRGLSDGTASRLARGKGQVERDVRYRGAPTLEEARGSLLAEALSGGVDAEAAKSPLTAAFLAFQWNMRLIQAPQAWASRPNGDRRVRVAILDTGLDPDHIDQGSLIDRASSIAFVPTTSPGLEPWADDQFHGTHVGGLVVTNNIGTAGVAPEATLIAIKVLNAAGEGAFLDLIAGLIHAANVRADVANLSLGVEFPKSGLGLAVAALNRAVNYANRHDVLVVSAAGNDNRDLQHNRNFIMIPCESGTGMCVSSVGPTDTKSSFSNYGVSAIDVASPGGEVGPALTHFVLAPCSSRSMIPALAGCRSRGGYLFVIGTSQAAPQVSGTAAYLDAQYAGALNPAQLQVALQQCSDDIGKPGTDQFYGQGRINVFKTVNDVDCNNSKGAALAGAAR